MFKEEWRAGEDAWGGQDGYKRKCSGVKTGNLEGGGIGVGLMRMEKIMVLDCGGGGDEQLS